MKAGMAFAIHDKAVFDRNRKRVLQIINKENREMYGVYAASVIEFRGHYFLIIDGHTSILDGDEYFAPAIAKIICPDYRKKKRKGHNLFRGLLQAAGDQDDLLETESFAGKREDIYEGVIYGEYSLHVRFVLDVTEEEQEQVVQDMFQATVHKKDIGEVKFLETLYELEV